MAMIQIVCGRDEGQQVLLSQDRLVIGRHPSSDFVLLDAAVSRHHAKISHRDGEYFLEDLDSRNGVYVNELLLEGIRQLQEDDQIRICSTVLSFSHRKSLSSSDLAIA